MNKSPMTGISKPPESQIRTLGEYLTSGSATKKPAEIVAKATTDEGDYSRERILDEEKRLLYRIIIV